MAALTQDRSTDYSLGDLLAIPVAAGARIFAGSLVCSNASGYAEPAGDTAGLVFEGVATEQADNTGGADGDVSVVVRRRGRFRFDCQDHLDQSAQSAGLYAVDDHTVAADPAQVTNDVAVGVLDRVESAHECWVSVDVDALNSRSWTEPTTTTV